MKREIVATLRADMLRDFPVESEKAPGWFFRVEEFSPGGYRAIGRDAFGRQIERQGTNDEVALRQAIEDAIALSARM